jgi:hypothetical protein
MSGRLDVGLGKILALEQQRLLGQRGEGVGEAVAKIEPGEMATLAVAAPGAAGLVSVVRGDGNNLDVRLVQPQIKFRPSRLAKSPSITIAASTTVAAEIRRMGSSAMRSRKVRASCS